MGSRGPDCRQLLSDLNRREAGADSFATDEDTVGTVVDNCDGTFGYAPGGNFDSLGAGESETDTFRYRLSNGDGGTASAKVEITVNGVNDVPTAVADSPSTDKILAHWYGGSEVFSVNHYNKIGYEKLTQGKEDKV